MILILTVRELRRSIRILKPAKPDVLGVRVFPNCDHVDGRLRRHLLSDVLGAGLHRVFYSRRFGEFFYSFIL